MKIPRSCLKKVVWTIAGSDSSSGAGIQADLQVFQHLDVYGASVVTAITAQNSQRVGSIHYVSPDVISAQLSVLAEELHPQAIKIGMLGQLAVIETLESFFKTYNGYVIVDPVMLSTSGKALYEGELKNYVSHLTRLFPYAELVIPNVPEAEVILDRSIHSFADIEAAARKFLTLGCKSVLIKGGHLHCGTWCHDYWTNGSTSFWLASIRYPSKNYRGTGCAYSSAIAAAMALGYEIKDALVIAKMYINRGIRLAQAFNAETAFIHHASWPEDEVDLPYLSYSTLESFPTAFPDCGASLGLYPVVDSSEWVRTLLSLGVKTIQLRIKNKSALVLEKEIKKSVNLAKKFSARLFINDYWELAIAHGAYGVHLGQEDLVTADMQKIHQAGLRLGVSTHCYYEVARAHAFRPSYLACGPIFPTSSKVMTFAPQGLLNLQRWRRTLTHYPLVAIGGIDQNNMSDVLNAGADGIAMISAITQAHDPAQQTTALLQLMERRSC